MNSSGWTQHRERGSQALLRLMIWITLHLGWPIARTLLVGIAVYFYLTSARARAASRDFLGRASGRPATARDVFRHILAFSAALLERVYLLSGHTEHFAITIEGLENLTGALALGRGCVLLGAHFGSFESLRAIARHAPVPVRPVMVRRNAGTAILEALDPGLAARVIELGTPDAMLRVREAVGRGEIVGMLADRALDDQKLIRVPFLGSPASFPTGPLIVAASIEAPVLLFFGIRTGWRRYSIQFEPFADRIALRRASRLADLEHWVGRYAASLEARCRAYPFNWSNFFLFWEDR